MLRSRLDTAVKWPTSQFVAGGFYSVTIVMNDRIEPNGLYKEAISSWVNHMLRIIKEPEVIIHTMLKNQMADHFNHQYRCSLVHS